MAKQTFTTGQVLTSSQMQSLQQTAMGGGSTTAKTTSYVLVAADAGTVVQMNAAGATTITVNTALFSAGDTVQIQNIGAGVCTVTAGTATVNTSSTLALKQYDSGDLYFNTTSAAFFFSTDAADITSPLTTKGDLYGFSTLDARIPIGTNNQVLTADSAQALGLKWATQTAGGITFISRTTFTNVASQAIDSVFSSTYFSYLVVIEKIYAATDTDNLLLQLRVGGSTITASSYYGNALTTTRASTTTTNTASNATDQMTIGLESGTSASPSGAINITFNQVGNSSENASIAGYGNIGGSGFGLTTFGFKCVNTATNTGFILTSGASNITGVVSVYGLAKA